MVNEKLSGKNKIESLQVLRAIAFVSIFLSHCEIGTGSIGVSIFFVLSGFLLVYKYYDHSPNCSIKSCLSFSYSHIKKIYPLHILMSLVALPFLIISARAVTMGSGTVVYIFKRLFVNILLIQSWFPRVNIRYSLNNLSWYLSVSAFLYFVFPVFLHILKKKNTIKRCVLWIIVLFLIQIFLGTLISRSLYDGTKETFEIVKGLTYSFPLYRTFDFFIGGFLGGIYLILMKNRYVIKQDLCNAFEIATVSFFVLDYLTMLVLLNVLKYQLPWWAISVVHVPMSVFLVMSFALNRGIITRRINTEWLISLGNLSPYLYLVHELIAKYIGISIWKIFHVVYTEFPACIFVAVLAFPVSVLFCLIWKKINNKSVT